MYALLWTLKFLFPLEMVNNLVTASFLIQAPAKDNLLSQEIVKTGFFLLFLLLFFSEI